QVFTSAIDDGDVYVYHEVLRAHLESLLVEREGEAGARSLYHRAATLLRDHGFLPEALRAYGRVEDWDEAEALLRDRGEEMIEGGAGWIEGLPRRLVDHDPWLQLALARRSLAAGCWRDAVDGYRRAEAGFGAGGGADICRRERLAPAGRRGARPTPARDRPRLAPPGR